LPVLGAGTFGAEEVHVAAHRATKEIAMFLRTLSALGILSILSLTFLGGCSADEADDPGADENVDSAADELQKSKKDCLPGSHPAARCNGQYAEVYCAENAGRDPNAPSLPMLLERQNCGKSGGGVLRWCAKSGTSAVCKAHRG
jgi:hypothetical protein